MQKRAAVMPDVVEKDGKRYTIPEKWKVCQTNLQPRISGAFFYVFLPKSENPGFWNLVPGLIHARDFFAMPFAFCCASAST